ncbi:hypothetical protein AcW1_004798 [Taiwanofungus camphoratus]|nr:hypothetical protein AcV7_003403 [Antrodia cinnamomea]KAI0939940.1 hypothetical protein AcV5_001181 [Antrodia cinnamomea]KAI0960225.1 hypothetical protein AcW1_004798 [Antrodia cinnamomea]
MSSLRTSPPSRELPDVPTPLDTDIPSSPESYTSANSAIPPSPPRDILTALPTHESSDLTKEASNNDQTTLTPVRAHYLKKQLISLQFQYELDALIASPTNNVSPFSYLGPPFSPPPKDAPRVELPFLRYCFRKFVLSFPFLAAAPRGFFPEKLQPFMASMLSRNLSSTSVLEDDPENSEEATRSKLLAKLERNMSMLLTNATKLIEKEEVVRLTQADLNRLEILAKKRAARERRSKKSFEINVVCVRTVIEKGRMRNRMHEEFIIRTRRSHQSDVFVSRRYGDFKTLVAELRKAHPDETIPPPPPKDRTFATVTVSAAPSMAPNLSNGSVSDSIQPPVSVPSLYAPSQPSAPYVTPSPTHMGRTPTRPPQPIMAMPSLYDAGRNSSNASITSNASSQPMSPTTSSSGGMAQQASRLAREKNRLTLRSYLHTLLSSSVLASSPVLRSFLLSGPTQLSPEEVEDARRREEADQVREVGRIRFAKEITARVDGLRDAVKDVKGELFAKDGLTHIFATIKETEDIRKLPQNYQAVIEWARISLASTVFQHFVAADSASESFASLKRIHGLMPYFMLKAALKISNPISMIRGVLDLFLAQPFGGRSLLQRMFTGSLLEEVKALEEDVEALKDKVNDPMICEKVRQFVYAPREIQAVYKADAAAENLHILAAVLRSGEEPILSRAQLQRIMYAHRAHKEYVRYTESLADSDDDEGPQNEEAWLFEDLSVLAKLYSRLRDREQLIELIFEGTTADLLKDIITIFYTPLAQVYRAASIADSLGDMQNFLNDLIRTVEQTEELSQQDPARTVQIFIDLIQRHEQSFYNFVHKVHSKGEDLFSNLMHWVELFLTLMRDGLGENISLEFLLPHTGQERADIVKEVDAIALYHYKLKVAYEDKVRRRFGRTQGLNDADAENEIAAEVVNGVVRDLSFGELIQGDADDIAAQETDSDWDSSDDEDDGSESGSSEDDSDGSDESDSNESQQTERETLPQRQITPVTRSHTIGYLPHPPRSHQDPKSIHHRQSLDPYLDRPPLPLRPSRSLTLSHPNSPSRSSRPPPLPSRDKDLPPPPPLKSKLPLLGPPRPRSLSVDMKRNDLPKPSPLRKKKNTVALKPPELIHLPRLLPVFLEMMRPQLRIQ